MCVGVYYYVVQVKGEWRDPCSTPSSDAAVTKLAQFKLSDKTVHLFARGTSRIVL